MKFYLLLLALPFMSKVTFALRPEQPSCQVHILTRQNGDMLTVVGQCRNDGVQPLALSYALETDKKGPTGTSHNSQSGRFSVGPGQTTILAQTTLRLSPADSYRFYLRAFDAQGQVVALDSLVHSPAGRP